MVNNLTYIRYIRQIATLFCDADQICEASVFSRLKNYLDDSNFGLFLGSINSRQWYYGNFDLPAVWIKNKGFWQTYFNYTNILSGQSGRSAVILRPEFYNPNSTDWKKVIEATNKPYLEFVSIVGNKIVFNSSELGGYGIAFVPSQPSSGSGMTTGSGSTGQTTTGSGNITVVTPSGTTAQQNPNTGQIVGTNNFKLADFDFQKLVIPGLLIAGFFIAKKYKVF